MTDVVYNLHGIIYRIFAVGGAFLLGGILLLLSSRFGNTRKKKTKSSVFSIFIIILALIYILFYTYVYIKPNIMYHDGYFVSMHRTSRVAPPLPFTSKLIFTDGEDPKHSYYIDSFSKKEIIPSDISTEKQYRVYYESITKIIVAIQEINTD